jgi:hypothetical protein
MIIHVLYCFVPYSRVFQILESLHIGSAVTCQGTQVWEQARPPLLAWEGIHIPSEVIRNEYNPTK